MPRSRNPNIDEAEKLYKQGNKLIDISNILNIAEGTIRSWKNRYNWDGEPKKNNATLQKNKSNATQRKATNKKVAKESVKEVVKEVMKNEELNDKQKLFCIYYSKCFNATKAYIKAYGCEYWTGAINGNKLLKNTKIREQINQLTELTMDKELLKRGLLQKYMDIAFSDIRDYMSFGTESIETEKGEYEISVVKLKDSSQVDGTLISEISQGKDGIRIKMLDKMKAMDFLSKHSNLLSDEEKTKLEIQYKQLANEKMQAEIDKLRGDNIEIEDTSELEGEIYGNS